MESARVTAMAMPILKRATKVYVLTIAGMARRWAGWSELSRITCARGGVPAEAVERSTKGRSPGETILDQTAALGGDLLVKGAYTQSRLRQMIFGGATSHVLSHAHTPVLMAN